MKGTTKKPVAETKSQVSPILLKEGGMPIGPGVVKRQRREGEAEATGGADAKYKPSEQVFRRRS